MQRIDSLDKLVRIGVIGLGDHSDRSHVKYITNMSELCTINGLADIDNQRIVKTNQTYGLEAKGYTNWRKLVASHDVDAIFIMTPDRLHAAQLAESVAMGKHVFCEKPLASNAEEYQVVEKALHQADQLKLVVSTCHPRRFDPPFIIMRDYLDNRGLLKEDFGVVDELGKVVSFVFNFDYHEPSKQGLHHSLMFDHLNHEVDAMNFLFGISGIAQATKHHDSEIAFRVTGQRNDKISFSFTGARRRKERIYPEDMRIDFENGDLAMNMHEGFATLTTGKEKHTRKDVQYKTDYSIRFEKINRHFLRSVLGIESPYISPEAMLINTKAAIDLLT